LSDPAVTPRVPSRFWYLVALVLFIGSIAAPVVITLWQVFGQEDAALRLVAPETRTLRLERGSYTVFSDSRAVINGEVVISQGSISGLRFMVRNARGQDIPVGPASTTSRYSSGGNTGFSVFEFNISESGDYTIATSFREADPRQRALLSVRKNFLGGLLGSIFSAVAISVIGTLLAVFIFVRTLKARGKLYLKKFKSGAKQGRVAAYTPPGNAKTQKTDIPSSPVQHQYDRDK
jgi:hypothetical protein